MSTEKRVKTLEEDIMESADWSTSTQTCISCTQGDLERSLLPIVSALKRLRRDPLVNQAREKLEKFFYADVIHEERVFKKTVSKAACELNGIAEREGPGSHSSGVHEYLKKHLEPIVLVLEAAKSPRVRRIGKLLRKRYEKRDSSPPMTREERFRYGLIPWKKMTEKERGVILAHEAEENHKRLMREERARRNLGWHSPWGY